VQTIPDRPAGEVTLPDGRGILIRPVRPDDKATLRRLFAALSDESRTRRFLRVTRQLEPGDLAALTEFDREVEAAFVVLDAESLAPVAVGRYVRAEPGAASAGVAVAVADAHQGRGIGTALVRHLARHAASGGIASLRALMFYDNVVARRVLEHVGPVRVVGYDPGVVELVVALAPEQASA
jgi:GNAT superfamily N-acetyltransferase